MTPAAYVPRKLSSFALQSSVVLVAIALLFCSAAVTKAQSALDGFDPNAGGGGYVRSVVVQPDGKILIGGGFTSLSPNGGSTVTRNCIARLNSNGTVDTSFDPNVTGFIFAVALQSDGKIIIGGTFSTINPNNGATTYTRNNIARLNSDGTVDTSFDPNANSAVDTIAVQSDGKIIIGGVFTTLTPNGGATVTRTRIARLNTDGTVDTSFDASVNSDVFTIALQSDSKILIGGMFTTVTAGATTYTRNRIARLETNGTVDTSFDPNASGYLRTIAVQPDKKILIGGGFASLTPNGGATVTRNNIARLNTDGTVDTSFDPNASGSVESVVLQTDGKILLGGDFTTVSSTGRNRMARLNSNGVLDTSFDPNVDTIVISIAVQSDGKILAGGGFNSLSPNGGSTVARNRIARVYADGTLDQTLDSGMTTGYVAANAIQADGKILVGGAFNTILGATRNNLARLYAGGTLDTSFDPNPDNAVFVIAVQPDGKIIIGGTFTSLTPNGGATVTRNYIARLNSDGTVDTSFNPNPNQRVNAIALQPDGKIIIVGFFTSLTPNGGATTYARSRIARLNADGSVDTSFDPNANNGVNTAALQPDGKILVAGSFSSLTPNGGSTVAQNKIARLNSDGTVDTSFAPNPNGDISAIAVQPDGKILIGGFFNTLTPSVGPAASRTALARLNTDGSVDSFNPHPSGGVVTIALQSNGKILIGGLFTGLSPNEGSFVTRSKIARVNSDGTDDASFNPNATGGVIVNSIMLQPDGKVLVGGDFTNIGGQARNLFARLTNDTAALQSLSVTQSVLSWMLSLASPELWRVTFEKSTDGVNYTSLGDGTRDGTTSTFKLTGQNLETQQNLYLRARGFYRGSYQTGSESIIESVLNIFLEAPTITAGGATTFCEGGSVMLTSSSASGNQWNKDGSPIVGQTNQQYVATASGSYTVTINGNTSSPVTVTVNPNPAPIVTPGGPTTFCQGGSVTLTSSSASGNQWYKDGSLIVGETAQQYVATVSGSYTVTVTDGNSCTGTSAPTTVTVNPTPSTPTITPNGDVALCDSPITLTSSSASGNQWYLNGSPITGATNQTYDATAAGQYQVAVTENGCPSLKSNPTTLVANPPVLTYLDQSVAFDGSLTFNPATGPSDNTSVSSIVVQSKGTYTGTISVDNSTGAVSVSGAKPHGTHTIVIRATDSCGATTDASFWLTVNTPTSLTVNDRGDTADANAGDGVCADSGGKCTLRAAIEETNALAGDETINFSLPFNSSSALTIELLTVLPGISGNLVINGPGANKLKVERSFADGTPDFRIFTINNSQVVTISGLTISNGKDSVAGGGIRNDGTLTLADSTVSGNSADGGGGIYNTRTLTIRNSTISNNSSHTGGGILIFGMSASANVINSTISGNTAQNAGSVGGGIRNSSGTLTVTSSTISNNSAESGGGIYNSSSGALAQIRSSIVAGNSATSGGPDLLGAFTSQGHNLIGKSDGSTGFTNGANNDIVGTSAAPVDPRITGLITVGPTATHLLLPGSPALDAGDDAVLNPPFSLTTDQRGEPRKFGTHVDIGSVEMRLMIVNDTGDTSDASPGDTICANSSGKCTLRAAMEEANAVSGNDQISFDLPGGSTITLLTALPDINDSLFLQGPGANQLTVRRSAASGTPDFRIFTINPGQFALISGMTITGGRVPDDLGGGILNRGENLNLSRVTVSGNTAAEGAGIYSAPSSPGSTTRLTITDSTISGNLRSAIAGGGGGINNAAGEENSTAILTITNSTISGNNAGTNPGGGIYNTAYNTGAAATVEITNTTITNNTAFNGGGLFSVAGAGTATMKLANTIVAGNFRSNGTTPTDISGTVAPASSFNLIGTGGSGGLTNGVNNNQVGVASPLLAPLANYGGTTETHALLPGSPAINAGTAVGVLPSPPSSDQRGVGRVGAVDIGSFESRGFSIAATSGTPQTTLINTAFASPLLATITSAFSEPVEGGVVTFTTPATGPSATFTGGVTTLNVTINALGQASAQPTANGTAGGPYNVTATANGISSGATFSLTNSQVQTTTSVTSSTNPSELGQNVTFTATVASSAGTPTGTVTFKDNGGAIPTCTNVALSSGQATCTINNLAVGNHTITADYSGDSNSNPSTGTLTGGQQVNVNPSISINDISLAEGNSGATNFVFTVTLSQQSNLTVTVDFATADAGGATTATAASDYAAQSGTLTFDPGQTTKTITVPVTGDTVNEQDEKFSLNLSNAQNATVSDNQGIGTILNDDSPTLQFSSATYQISEGANNSPQGFTSLSVDVVRGGDISQAATVRYITSDQSGGNECDQVTGFASQRCDYTLVGATLRFAAGESTKSVSIPITNDGYKEGNEIFNIQLKNPVGATLGSINQATVTISDDLADNTPTTPQQNPYLSNEFFVRQDYLDNLGREADQAGFTDWTNVLNNCGPQKGFLGAPKNCDRAHVAHGFFGSEEFTTSGFLLFRLYEVGMGRLPLYREFIPDMATLSGFGLSDSVRQQNLSDYLQQFAAEAEFVNRFQSVSQPSQAAQLIEMLEQTAGVTLPATTTTLPGQPAQYGRAELIQKRSSGQFSLIETVKAFVEQKVVYDRYFTEGEVTMMYFVYLRRDPSLNDPNLTGWKDWVQVFTNGGLRSDGTVIEPRDIHHLIFGFIYSEEYRKRFGQP